MTFSYLSSKKIVVVIFSVLVIAGIIAFKKTQISFQSLATGKRLGMIMLALEGYYEANGHYPPQYVTDDNGKPIHSWRILILPYLGYDSLYHKYNFQEPWNGPHNRLLMQEMPEEFRSPFISSKSLITQYVGISGQETPWQGTNSIQKKDISKPLNTTIWFVEAANSNILWMEPRDITFEQASTGINNLGTEGIQSNYTYGLPAQMMSYERTWIPIDTSKDNFRKMLIINN